MSELEKIFESFAPNKVGGEKAMNYNGFKSALTEVFDKVRVTNEEVKSYHEKIGKDEYEYSKLGAKFVRDLQQQKLEKILNP